MDAPALVEPSAAALLDWLRRRLTGPMLEEIAHNDYGEEVAEHLAGIEAQLRDDVALGMLAWHPREVLELERNVPDYDPPSPEREHFKRLLACTILLRNAAKVVAADDLGEESFFLDTSALTVIRLVRSAIAVNGEAPCLAMGLLLWVCESQQYPAFLPFAAFGVLLLAARAGPAALPVLNLRELCDWVIAVETQCRKSLGPTVESARWLVGTNYQVDNDEHRQEWANVAKAILTQEATRSLMDRFAWGVAV